jgi:hypothetical protein
MGACSSAGRAAGEQETEVIRQQKAFIGADDAEIEALKRKRDFNPSGRGVEGRSDVLTECNE